MNRKLSDVIAHIPGARVTGDTEGKMVNDLTIDSRTVQPGSLFICIKGVHTDGHQYIGKAAQLGAAAVLIEEDADVPKGVAAIRVDDTTAAMTALAPWFYDYPAQKMRMIGVTGTNGKTTTTNILRELLTNTGHKVGLIGTINIMIGDEKEVSHNTTPNVVDLQKTLYRMAEAHCDYCVMEVSSHALALNRVAGIEYDTAALTNITEDHLDFHKTMENYREAKALLFTHLHEGKKPRKTAVFNMDDPSSPLIMNRVKTKIITYGKAATNDIHPISFEIGAKSMKLDLTTPAGEMKLALHITGEFNVYNVMTAVGCALAEGLSRDDIVRGLDDFGGVPGRFQLIDAGQPFTVIVDYAHTPDGLDNVLKTAREITKGKLWCVFGCGGDRDRKKRPIMGKIALDLADVIVVTSDNPRSEDPDAIIKDIEEGLKDAPGDKEIHTISDRRSAIEFAISHAAPDDVIMIAGKGHENYQILKDRTIHFDDGEVVRDYFRKGKANA
ncbi:MAG: UDP-N-acetylmuramoyl-L-alanyl-D-glutamate--2,6-diaminopimelate ligase [Acidaminococcus sp.]|jgi:UDP-N-acetylmuramyl-tripeptide synthetase|nr:UDP-N-acetylmuramoyl-L-alanyl-D-glutamate--2,6-diaminopimelate ligase [Acidaminococcus sp.]MCI2100147.1 UDP-N-acetylmuramoyl-L-alanyl-D-glutamate--2,6-diaminopimelate ligase [Acidaminococcus sp.]MCI2114466.1 UDP-N-acetylmuramoyl-L-alanyl-D-glutamate--2,6-diaminopimelate ligase [Acidaminococcus sp.]MCI2116401.1 UDP-N-acetylmuramoyl-L-alanyl-D-glutamate--2,6-diaminopimelate ligase [Acidaminococcus sp.]